MANGGMYGEEEKKYSWLEKGIAIKAKKKEGMYIRLQEPVSFVQTIS